MRFVNGTNSVNTQTILSINFFPTFYPPSTGGEQRAFYVLQGLSAKRRIISVSPTFSDTRDEIVRHSENIEEHRFTKTQTYRSWHQMMRQANIGIGGADLAMSLSAASHSSLRAAVAKHWQVADTIIVQHPSAVPLIKDLDTTNKRIVYLSHNCELELAGQRMAEAGWMDYLALVAQLESRLCRMADHIVVCSEDDKIKMMALYGAPASKLILIPNGSTTRFDVDCEDLLQDTDPRRALFLGSNWGPNAEAANIIVEEIAKKLPLMTFDIVGSVCHSITSTPPRNVRLHFEANDIELAYLMKCAHFGISPMRSGGGSSVKIADYLAHGLQVVATPVGARGFPESLGNLHIVEMSTFSDTLARLSKTTPSSSDRMSWRQRTRSFWSWPELSLPLSRALDEPLPKTTPLARTVILNEFPVKGTDNGGEARIAGLYKAAREGEIFLLLSFGRQQLRLNLVSPHLICLELPASTRQHAAVAEANKATFSSVNDFTFPMTVSENPAWLRIARILATNTDGIVMAHPFMLPVYERLAFRRPFVHDSHNVETLLKWDALETHKRRAELVAEVRRQERMMMEEAELIAACSDSDASYFRRYGAKNVIISPNGVDLLTVDDYAPRDASAKEGDFGQPRFSARRVYLIEEFEDLSEEDFSDAAYLAVLGRAPKPTEAELIDLTAPNARARVIVELMDHPEARRVLVVGAKERLGHAQYLAVFMGSGHRPNLAAAEFVAWSSAPNLPLEIVVLIVGGVGDSMVARQLPPNVYLTGFVSKEMKALLLKRSFLGLNPIIGGGGSNLKVPDYLAHGLPVLSSEFGQRGFKLGPEEGLHTAPLHAFAEAIVSLKETYARQPFDSRAALAILRQDYAWQAISSRFLTETRRAFTQRQRGDILVVCSDLSLFRYPALSAAARLVRGLGERGRVYEVLGTGTRMSSSLAISITANIPRSIPRITTVEEDLETEIHHAAHLKYSNILWHKLDVVVAEASSEDIERACQGMSILKPVLLSGAGSVAAAADPWRFVSDEVVLALPKASRALVLKGVAHFPTNVEISLPNGQILAEASARGKFNLALELDQPVSVVVMRSRPSGHEPEPSRLRIQLSEFGVDIGQVILNADLWLNSAQALTQLGLRSRVVTFVSGLLTNARAHEFEQIVSTRAPTARAILAIGHGDFVERVFRVAGSTPVIGCNGVSLRAAGRDEHALDWPIDDIEASLICSPKERAYLASQLCLSGGILLLVDQLDGETARFAWALQERLTRAEAKIGVSLLIGNDILAAELDAGGQVLVEKLSIVRPESDKATLALLSAARLVVIRDDAVRFARVPYLLSAMGVVGAVWRSALSSPSAFAELASVATVEEALELAIVGSPAIAAPISMRQPVLDQAIEFIDGSIQPVEAAA